MAAQLTGVFDDKLQEKINESKVLVVGAGGIGCEILKNLVMSGFKDIEIIDLDTIDVSNLNRQFLFHREHVGKSKAEVARKSALAFNPNVEIKAYHDSIISNDYGVPFFKRFKIVLNALDNRQARNHVNRMCLAADIPLIESGTSGYNGQVELIKRGLSKCYECTPKQKQKTFPGCTIRNTPSEPIHCIVWAKHLFNQLFGEDNADEDVSPDTADPEATANAGNDALNETPTAEGNIERVSTKKWAKNSQYDPEKLFNKFFSDDIKYLLSMENLWKTRTAPKPIDWNDIYNEDSEKEQIISADHQRVWSIGECGTIFAKSLNALKDASQKMEDESFMVWDKDDKDAMDFVATCANIRCTIFGIPTKSRFDIKSMAGNIIPAIATTNAIVAGISLMHTFKVLQEQYENCQSVYVRLRPNGRNQFFVPDRTLDKPNPNCYVCAPKPVVNVSLDMSRVTIKYLRDEILIKALNMIDPDVIIDGRGVILISSDEDETECNNEKFVTDFQIRDGNILKVDDFLQNYTLDIIVYNRKTERDDDQLYEVISDPSVKLGPNVDANETETEKAVNGEKDKPKKARYDDEQPSTSHKANNKENNHNDDDDEDDLVLIDESVDASVTTTPKSGTKRKGIEENTPPVCKRSKVTDNGNRVDGDDEDIIMLDD